jgi:glycosyltransferase involved in cell wall biosynthesis
VKLGIVARMDRSGLRYQTHALTRMLQPSRVLLIDSTPFNGRQQHPELYSGYQSMVVRGTPSNSQCLQFLRGLSHVIICETPMSYFLIGAANRQSIKTIFCPNPEFFDYFNTKGLPNPWHIVAPSSWLLGRLRNLYANTVVIPPPMFSEDFDTAFGSNMHRIGPRRRLLHVAGTPAAQDRAGTDSVIRALDTADREFELVIKAQTSLSHRVRDDRVRFDFSDPINNAELYSDFDAMVQPRRYGGLNLPMNEALMSGLPVLMTDIPPNDVLPSRWLVPAAHTGQFMTRLTVDVHSADTVALGEAMDWVCTLSDDDLMAEKQRARQLALGTYSVEAVKPRWLELLNG